MSQEILFSGMTANVGDGKCRKMNTVKISYKLNLFRKNIKLVIFPVENSKNLKTLETEGDGHGGVYLYGDLFFPTSAKVVFRV